MDINYRQVIRRAFRAVQNALAFIDVSQENLEQSGCNTVTISTTVIKVDSFFELTDKDKVGMFQLVSGGPVNWNCFIPPTAGRTEGSHEVSIGDYIRVTGKDLRTIQFVKATGASADGTMVGSKYQREK